MLFIAHTMKHQDENRKQSRNEASNSEVQNNLKINEPASFPINIKCEETINIKNDGSLSN